MRRINKILTENPRYRRFQKPLEAARVCEAAREIARHRFGAVSFKNGLLTLSVQSTNQAANLQSEKYLIIEKINKKIGKRAVEKIRFKITK